MRCQDARDAWHKQLDDGLISPGFQEHLLTCERCRQYVADMEQIVGALDELRDDSAEMSVSIRQRRVFPFVRKLTRIAAVIVLLIGGYLLIEFVQKPSRTEIMQHIEKPTVTNDVPTGITLRGQSRENLLAVAGSSKRSDVQMYWLYATIDARSKPAPRN